MQRACKAPCGVSYRGSRAVGRRQMLPFGVGVVVAEPCGLALLNYPNANYSILFCRF